jgi:hypothetical protein
MDVNAGIYSYFDTHYPAQNQNMNVPSKSCENVAMFKYLGTLKTEFPFVCRLSSIHAW